MNVAAQYFRLDSQKRSIVLRSHKKGIPEIIYWADLLAPDVNLETLDLLVARAIPHGHPDQDIPVSVFPEASRGFTGPPAISFHRDGKGSVHQFTLESVDEGDDSLSFHCSDTRAGLELRLEFAYSRDTEVMSTRSILKNIAEEAIDILSLTAPSIALSSPFTQVLNLHGRWGHEYQEDRSPLGLGRSIQVENRRGRTSHESFPGMVLLGEGANELSGNVLGAHLAWSGNYRIHGERLLNGLSLLQAVELFLPGEMTLSSGDSLESPWLYLSLAEGLREMSQQFHSFARKSILPASTRKERPVLANSWEALYFDHDIEKLKKIIDCAEDVGVERFVLDDGWFKGRRNDSVGLGDWQVDEDVYPEGLSVLSNYVVKKGMSFGLWFEPEMVNPNSELFRQHPDWILHHEDYPKLEERQQLVLDLTRPEAFTYMDSSMKKLLTEYPISYIKWDMNRCLHNPVAKDGRLGVHKQVKAVYALMASLLADFPDLEIESCSSGGGRIDYGILKYCSRVWASDNNDPVSRCGIHRGYSYFFPPEIMGSHVGDEKAHLTGRKSDIHFRSMTTLQGVPGFELDLSKQSQEDLNIYKTYMDLYKDHRSWLNEATLIRDHASYGDYLIYALISQDKKNSLWWVQNTTYKSPATGSQLKFSGLDESIDYQVSLESGKLSTLSFPMKRVPPFWELMGEVKVSGSLLKKQGICIPCLPPQSGVLLSLKGE